MDRILLVDDEPHILSGYSRGLRQHFDVVTAESGAKGLEMVEVQGEFAVVVSDMRMPMMDGVEFLKRVRRLAPNSIRMMLTGNADQQTAIDAVNKGAIFRFLTKPCPNNSLVAALAMGVRQYKLVTAEKDLLEKTVKGSVAMLTELLSIMVPEAFKTADKIRGYVRTVCTELGLENAWELEVAAMLSPIGILTLPSELRDKVFDNSTLSEVEREAVADVPEIGKRLLSHVPRLEDIGNLVGAGIGKRWEKVAGRATADPKLETEFQVIRILSDLVGLEESGKRIEDAFDELARHPERYDSEMLPRIRSSILDADSTVLHPRTVIVSSPIRKLMIGDILVNDAETIDGRLLLASGTRITAAFLERLNNYRRLLGVQEPVEVRRDIGLVGTEGV